MDEILIRSEQQARDPVVKAEAKRKLEKLEDDGKKIRDEAMRGQAKLDSVGKEKAKKKRQKRNNELQALQDLSEQLKEQEVEEKVLLETMRKEESEFRVTLLQQSQRTEASMNSLVAELQRDRENRAQEHRELLLALLATVQRQGSGSSSSGSSGSGSSGSGSSGIWK
ncbi:hypothetical protein EV426DRAFT_203281 [Tirmania nivea]|nr:hypothetical protein EV426DRAFT_203281 [Tirmania nivea]